MLFIDDHQPQIGETHIVLQQLVRADNDIQFAVGQLFERAVACAPLRNRDRTSTLTGQSAKRSLKVWIMLLSEECGRHQHRHLSAGLGDRKGRAHRDLGLAESRHRRRPRDP